MVYVTSMMTRFRFLRLPHVLVNNSIFHSFREQKVWNWFDINELRDALSASKYIQSLNSDPLVNLGHLSNRDVNWKRAIDVCRFLITLTLGTGRRAGRFEHLVIHFWWLSQLLIVKSIFFYILIFFDFFPNELFQVLDLDPKNVVTCFDHLWCVWVAARYTI